MKQPDNGNFKGPAHNICAKVEMSSFD